MTDISVIHNLRIVCQLWLLKHGYRFDPQSVEVFFWDKLISSIIIPLRFPFAHYLLHEYSYDIIDHTYFIQ